MESNVPELIRYNLKRIRKLRGMTQEDVAKAMDTPTSAYNRIEAGRALPTLKTLIRATEALSIPITDVFVDHSKEPELSEKLKLITRLPKDERASVEHILSMILSRYELPPLPQGGDE